MIQRKQFVIVLFCALLPSYCIFAQQSGRPGFQPANEPQSQTTFSRANREVEVRFQSGSIALAGTLLIPAGPERRPAIVLTHGSGPGPRGRLRMFAERFANDGLVVLFFDKRGSGQSAGSWINASLDDLATDAVSAATFLRSRPEVDPKRIGVWGVSQAGWVIPRAVAVSPEAFQFAVVITGGAVKPIEVERYDYGEALKHLNLTAEQQQRAMDLVEKYFEYLRTGADRKGLESALASARSEPWFPAVDVSRVLPSEEARAKWEWVATYDPVPDIQRLRVPILVVIGGKDRPALSAAAQQRWRDALNNASNHDATEVVFLNAGHGITMGSSHGTFLSGGSPAYAPGYLELVDAWLKAHLAGKL